MGTGTFQQGSNVDETPNLLRLQAHTARNWILVFYIILVNILTNYWWLAFLAQGDASIPPPQNYLEFDLLEGTSMNIPPNIWIVILFGRCWGNGNASNPARIVAVCHDPPRDSMTSLLESPGNVYKCYSVSGFEWKQQCSEADSYFLPLTTCTASIFVSWKTSWPERQMLRTRRLSCENSQLAWT